MFVGLVRQNMLRPRGALRQASLRRLIMKMNLFRHIYGPVPSRRLGRSLGIDLVPFKTCTYDCIYCQLGRTTNKIIRRKEYVAVAEIMEELERKLARPEALDFISLAGSGEPTLNSRIGDLILRIKSMTNIPVAVLTNGSLLWDTEVQDALMAADLVLPSLDAGDARLYRYVNRPHPKISFQRMVDGLAGFADRYKGEIWLEVFLLGGVTGIRDEAEKIASVARRIRLKRIQLNTVVRPPAESFARPVSRNQMQALKCIFNGDVEIIGVAGRTPAPRAPVVSSRRNDILAMLSRRPCTASDVARSLGIHISEALKYMEDLVAAGKAAVMRAGERTFYAASRSEQTSKS